MSVAYPLDTKSLLLDTKEAREIGTTYAERYQSAKPYNHICIDNFLPMGVIEKIRADLDSLPNFSRHLFQLFKPRPGSADSRGATSEKIRKVAKDVLPPVIYRNGLRVVRRLGL